MASSDELLTEALDSLSEDFIRGRIPRDDFKARLRRLLPRDEIGPTHEGHLEAAIEEKSIRELAITFFAYGRSSRPEDAEPLWNDSSEISPEVQAYYLDLAAFILVYHHVIGSWKD